MFEVWAPKPGRVVLALGDERVEMSAAGGGWWRCDADAAPDTRYGFVLDDGDTVYPDPRSRRQPDGVHAPSATWDPSFPWTDASWTGRQLAGGVIYELHLGTFTPEGTLDSAIERLDHLVELGIDFVELLPVNAVNGRWNWGYDGVLWHAVTENYGGPTAYQRFVDAAHERGLAVIQDVVYNHLGPSGNYLPLFGPYLHEGSSNTWGDSLNLDEPAVRAYVLENVRMWFEHFHVDGLRLDAVHALVDTSPKHILQEMAEQTDAFSAHLGRPLTLIAESDMNDPKLILPREAGGYGLSAQWSDDYHHSLHVAVTGETTGYYADFASLEALAKTSTRGFFHDGTYSSFRGRDHGHPIPSEVPTWRLVTFAQDHDQIGNRATGDRLTASLDARALAVTAVLTLAAPGTPMLFMGEEWGAKTPWQFFTSHPEHDLGEATARGRIEEFAAMGWDESVVPDPQDPATFERSKLDWSEAQSGDSAALLSLYRRLTALRRDVLELTDPAYSSLAAEFDDAERWFRLDRGAVSILVNLAESERSFPVSGTVLLDTAAEIGSGAAALGNAAVVLRPVSALVLRRIEPQETRE
jgi:maltooligosyltrehalose trehalohydrolase